MKNRKTYSKEFKLDAIALVRDQNYPVAEAARNLDVSAGVFQSLEFRPMICKSHFPIIEILAADM